MPSFEHETLVTLFKNRPELAVVLLRDAVGLKVPQQIEARHASIDLGDIEPAERYADCVVTVFRGTPHRKGRRQKKRALLAIIVEVQLGKRARKLFTWPAYLARVRADHECDAVVLVIAPDARVARWASRPIRLGYGSVVQPLVIGPKGVPVIRRMSQALRAPELGVLSAIAHGRGEPKTAARIALATLQATERRAAKYFELYYDWIVAALSPAAREAFEMLPEGYQFRDKSLRRSFKKGQAEGRAEGQAEAIVAVLEARAIRLSRTDRERILRTTDAATLARWIRKAATVNRAEELFTGRVRQPPARRRAMRSAAHR